MANETQAPGLSTTQAAVQIVQNMTQCGMNGAHYEKQVEDLHALMAEWAIREIQKDHPGVTVEQATHEDNEMQPYAEAYWAATSSFFRKVFQACAAGA